MTLSYTLEELSLLTKSQLFGDKTKVITSVASLQKAQANELSFLSHPRYLDSLKTTQAGAVCISSLDALLSCSALSKKNYLISADPSLTFQTIAELFLKQDDTTSFKGIHPSAVIHPSAKIDPTATIGAFVFIDQDVEIGPHTIIYPHCFIGKGVKIGSDTKLYSFVTIREVCLIGSNVIIQPGAVIGSCGFGYLPQKDGSWEKIKQLGIVVIEDQVEIGANTTIDRARFDQTIIRKGAKIDNLVQLAHNVEVGPNSAIAAQSGISGSTKTGSNVILAGQVGVAGHLELASQVMVAAKGGVSKDLKPGKYRGAPAIPFEEYNRQMVHLRKIAKYLKRIEELEKKVKILEEKVSPKSKETKQEPAL